MTRLAGRAKVFSKTGMIESGRVGSGGVRNLTGRIGSFSFQNSRVGSG